MVEAGSLVVQRCELFSLAVSQRGESSVLLHAPAEKAPVADVFAQRRKWR